MIDQIEQLEHRVEVLIGMLEEARNENGRLFTENERLRRQLEERETVAASNDQLQQQVVQLEGEIEGMANKETQIRERLHKILGKIDTIEREINASGGSAAKGG